MEEKRHIRANSVCVCVCVLTLKSTYDKSATEHNRQRYNNKYLFKERCRNGR